MELRKWVPDVNEVAEQLVTDYLTADNEPQGALDVHATLHTWLHETAPFHGSEWTEDDWVTLVLALLRRMADQTAALASVDRIVRAALAELKAADQENDDFDWTNAKLAQGRGCHLADLITHVVEDLGEAMTE
jgi:hypothetical protein